MYLCYHHDDMDGKTSAFHIYKFLEEFKKINPKSSDFIMRGYDEAYSEQDYGDKDVFIVDLSFTKNSVSDLFDICEGAHSVTWIDHHKSSKEILEDEDLKAKLDGYKNLEYLINTDFSATVLTYLYSSFYRAYQSSLAKEWMNAELDPSIRYTNDMFNNIVMSVGDYTVTLEQVPNYIQYVDRYDRWVYGDDVRPMLFNYGCMTHSTNLFVHPDKYSESLIYNSIFWDQIHMHIFTRHILDDGRIAKKYSDVVNRSNRIEAAYERDVLGYKAIIMNTFGNSLVFGEDAPKNYDVLIIYNYNGKHKLFNYSFYSSNPNVDCSKIAAHFDPKGGGHKGAAGCSSKEFLFK